jgi:nucleoside-triphosphatase THEP1
MFARRTWVRYTDRGVVRETARVAGRVASAFVGRRQELHALSLLLDEALAGSGRLVVLTGEGGVGKTRLCEELAAMARERGGRVAWAACWEAGGVPSFWAWRQLVAQLTGRELAAIEEVESDVARARLAATVIDVIRTAAQASPTLLVLDDVHWADTGTLLLLRDVAPVLHSTAALIVATSRQTDAGRSRLPRELLRHGRTLVLDGLSVGELGELAEALTGSRLRADVCGALHRATAGNALFAVELLRRLSREGDLDRWPRADGMPVPPTVRAVLDEHLTELSEGCRELLRIAAVIGGDVRVAVLADVAGRHQRDILAELDEAIAGGVISTSDVDRFSFTHPLLRSVLRDEIGMAMRVHLHGRIAESLEAGATQRHDLDLAALSYHYLNAGAEGTAGKAAHYAEQAARSAMAALGYEDAAELFDRALAANQLDPSTSDRVSILLGAGEARAASGQVAEARIAFLAAAEGARALGRHRDLAVATLGLAGSGFEVALFDAEQIALLDEAIATVGEDEPGLRSRLCARLSVALSLSGQEHRRAALSADAVRLAKAAGEPSVLAHALAARCDARAGPEHIADRVADADAIVRIAQERNDHGTELLGRRLRLVAALEQGDLTGVDAEILGFERLADRLRQPRHQWYTRLWRAALATMRGRLTEQEAFAAEAEELGRAAGSSNAPILVFTHRWLTFVETGAIEKALGYADSHAPPGTWAEWGPQMVPVDAQRALIAGRADDARAILDGAGDTLRHLDRDSEWLTTMAHIADACFQLGGHDLTAWLYDAMQPFADMWAVDGTAAYSVGCVQRHLGMLAALLGRADVADRHFAAALAAHRRAGADLLIARTLLDRAVALSEAGTLQAARATYAVLGVARRVQEIDALIAHSDGENSTGSAAPERNQFRREGDTWSLVFRGRRCSARNTKGIHDLARLLAQPGREMTALDLAAPLGQPPLGDLGDTVDAQARAAYRARLAELGVELDEAEAAGDDERSARAGAERDALVQQLANAYGLGGRGRRSGAAAERARTAVTARVRDAIRKIETLHPDLGRHLARSVRTGTFCCYDPDPLIHWEL